MKIKQNDAREGKHMQNCAKISPLFAYKTLVLLKKTVEIDVSTYESVQ